MVPKHSFLQQISSCLISTVPEKFYDRVEEGSIILKKGGANFSFCQQGVLVNGEETPLETDLVILATGFRGDKKLRDIFMSSFFKDHVAGSPNAAMPLYRYIYNYLYLLQSHIIIIFIQKKKNDNNNRGKVRTRV